MRDHLLPLSRAWLGIIKKGFEHKRKRFGKDADECRRFLDGPYDWLYSAQGQDGESFFMGMDDNIPRPSFRMTSNKTADVVQLFGPSLYSRNPHRQVEPRRFAELPYDLMIPPGAPQDDPRVQQMIQQLQQQESMDARRRDVVAGLMSDLLNYTPNELDLEWNNRQAIDEALITGLGLLWTEVYRPKGSTTKLVGSFYDTVDNLVIDPDFEKWADLQWIARRRIEPTHKVERKFGLKKGSIRGGLESAGMQAVVESNPGYDYYRRRGDTTDLTVYWEIYSRMGIGHHLSSTFDKGVHAVSDVYDKLGENLHLFVCEDYPGFLNLTEKTSSLPVDEVRERLQWPTPFWKDPTDPWPVSRHRFHDRSRSPWPMSHVKPGLGELKFMNWTLSFLADKVKNTSRDFIAVLSSAADEIRETIANGRDLELLPFERTQGTINDVIQFLQHPPLNKDILEVYQLLNREWEQRTGLSMLMYGDSPRQMRSAAEAQQKGGQLRIRPDDMANKTEETSTLVARKEMIAAYWHYTQEDVRAILGEARANLYANIVMSMSIDDIVREMAVTIETGSIRKPNKDKEIANANVGVQVWQGMLQGYASVTGDYEPIDWLLQKWCKANDIPNSPRLKPPPPPQPDQTAIQQHQMEMEIAQQRHEQDLSHRQEDHEAKVGQTVQQGLIKSQLDKLMGMAKLDGQAITLGQGLAGEMEKHRQSMRMNEESHDQDLQFDAEDHSQEYRQQEAMNALQIQLAKYRSRNNSNGNESKSTA